MRLKRNYRLAALLASFWMLQLPAVYGQMKIKHPILPGYYADPR